MADWGGINKGVTWWESNHSDVSHAGRFWSMTTMDLEENIRVASGDGVGGYKCAIRMRMTLVRKGLIGVYRTLEHF